MRCQYIISTFLLAVLSLVGTGSATATMYDPNLTAETWKYLLKYWEEQAKKLPELFNVTYTKPAQKDGTPLVTITVTPQGPNDTPDAERLVISCLEAHCLSPEQTKAFWVEMSKLDWGQVCTAGNTNLEFQYQNGLIVPATVGAKPEKVTKCKRAKLDIPDQTAENAMELQTAMEAFKSPNLTNTKIIFSFIDSNGTIHEFPVNLQFTPPSTTRK